MSTKAHVVLVHYKYKTCHLTWITSTRRYGRRKFCGLVSTFAQATPQTAESKGSHQAIEICYPAAPEAIFHRFGPFFGTPCAFLSCPAPFSCNYGVAAGLIPATSLDCLPSDPGILQHSRVLVAPSTCKTSDRPHIQSYSMTTDIQWPVQ